MPIKRTNEEWIREAKKRLKLNIEIDENKCWKWKRSKYKNGYGKMSYKGKYRLVHRLSYELFIGKIPKNNVVCHKCDTPICCNPNHLWTGTLKDNSEDMVSKGRKNNQCGEKNPYNKMSNEKVKELRKLRKQGLTIKKLALMFNIGYGTTQAITSFRTWKHLGE